MQNTTKVNAGQQAGAQGKTKVVPFKVLTDRLPTIRQSSETALERHFRVQEVAELWGLSDDCIRDLFENEPGVIIIDRPETLHKRRYRTIRIPESVVRRVAARLAA